MPNGRAHFVISTIPGAIYSAYRAKDELLGYQFLETFAGTVAAGVGGAFPDRAEPATNPNHRAFFHSLVAAVGAGVAHDRALDRIQSYCRSKATNCERALACTEDILEKAWLWMQVVFWRILSGAAAGLYPGYLLHILADATTPKSVPVW